jgi:hypothetical protein
MRINYLEFEVTEEYNNFSFKGEKLFDLDFLQVFAFHPPGLAAVQDETGWYHIKPNGKAIYENRYDRAFGYYFNRAAVLENGNYYHLNTKGKRVYKSNYNWCGNYQQKLCTVRDDQNFYFHIDLDGNRVYKNIYLYAGDYYENYACVKNLNGKLFHINRVGEKIYNKEFYDLGVYHKGYASARDQNGWFHIDLRGREIYKERYLSVEPFYNGTSLVTTYGKSKQLIDEFGNLVLNIWD